MADRSVIEWTDATWSPITGCSVMSPGCTNCYAMRLAGTRLQHHPSRAGLTRDSKAGPVWTGEVRFNEQWLTQPLRWKRQRMIFVAAHGDLFHERVPDEWIDRVFAVMALCPQHRFQVLTKRSARMRAYCQQLEDEPLQATIKRMAVALGPMPVGDMVFPSPNVWLGVSCEDQARADERIPDLLQTPAAVRFVSLEPLLGAIDLMAYLHALDWVIAGGESGPRARSIPGIAIPRSLRDQCAAARKPFFWKQWGEYAPTLCDKLPVEMIRVGKKRAGRLLDGELHNGMPV